MVARVEGCFSLRLAEAGPCGNPYSTVVNPERIHIRPCTALADFDRCVEIQRILGGSSERDLWPKEIFVVASKVGGHVLGVFDGQELIGFDMASPGYQQGRPYLCSHISLVLPPYPGRDIRRLLKLEQRQDALARGFGLVEWTFDPLVLRNAHLDIEGLGVIVRRFADRETGLRDQVVAEWWLGAPRVEAALRGQRQEPGREHARVHVPLAFHELKKTDRAAGEKIRAEVSGQFDRWFKQGYAITGFEPGQQTGTYLLEAIRGLIPPRG